MREARAIPLISPQRSRDVTHDFAAWIGHGLFLLCARTWYKLWSKKRPQNAEVRHAARDPPLDAPWRLLRAEAIGMRERLRAAS